MHRALLVLLLAAACATSRRASAPPAGPAAVAFEADEPRTSELDAELAGKNEEELLAIGTAAYAAADHARAAAAFARLADVAPSSRHAPAALFGAGLAYQRLGEWRLALERFRRLEREHRGPEAGEAPFRIAECHYHLGELGDAHGTLEAIVRRGALAAGDRVRALAQRGVVELELGRREDAERSLRLAVSTYEEASRSERLEDEYAAQAQFYLGEVHRESFRSLPLDPARGDDEALRRALDSKAEMLLSAQGHYLGAIRLGNDRWAIAAGFRVGELYDELRTQLLAAPLPAGLGEEHAAAYRSELRERIRVLAAKAITAYEQTLGRAALAGLEELRFLADARAALERLRTALADETRPSM